MTNLIHQPQCPNNQCIHIQTHSRPFTPAEIEAAQAAFSNLIGGVGYFQGRTSIKAGDEAGTVLEVGESIN
jgi:hypothetical protein